MTPKDILRPKSGSEIDTIVNNFLKEFEELHLPINFKWRIGQKEAVQQIIKTYLENQYKTVILDSPVGSGKSLIAMAVAFILNSINKKGYVLTSDISLQDQYKNDIDRMKLPWGLVKGIDHYMCNDNGEKHSLGTCKIRAKNPKSMQCYNECPYFSARDFAASAQTSVLNYSYWLIMQHYVKPVDDRISFFSRRDFTICDEAHKILDIVQSHYSPRFTNTTVERLDKLSHFFIIHNVSNNTANVKKIEESIHKMHKTNNQDELYELLRICESSLKPFLKSIDVLKDKVNQEYSKKKPPKEWREALFLSDWVKDIHCKIQDYNFIISQTNTRNLVKNPTVNELIFNCLEENFLMNTYFHTFTGFTVLMSATFADPKEFMRGMSIKNAKYIKVDNIIPFEKSPIYYYPKRKMSYKEIDKNREWLYAKVNEILNIHKNDRGIIHSVSYDLTMKVKQNLSAENSKRVFVYDGTEDKRKALDMMKELNGQVIMGPSLLEGLDMKDDWSRFQIFLKVPYPSLADRFIKAKLDMNPNWYRWKSIVHILQGVGRSIRNEEDWAITYILDGSLSDLIHNNRSSFPNDFLQRINIVNE